MTGQEYYEEWLTSEEQNEFGIELISFNGIDGAIRQYEREYMSFDSFLSTSFPWAKTRKGHDYWCDISERKEPITQYRIKRYKFI